MTFPKTTFILLSLLALFFHTAAADSKKKECITLSRGKELKEKVTTSNVLLVLGSEEDDETYKELCSRLESTPMPRVKDLEIAFVKDSNMKRNVMAKAEPPKVGLLEQAETFVTNLILGKSGEETPPDKTEISYPEYVLYKKDNAEAGIRFVGGPQSGGEEDDSETKAMANAVSGFIADQLQTKKLGSYVYALGSYDIVATQVMKYDTGSWQQKLWAVGVANVLKTMFLRYPVANMFGTNTQVMDFEQELIDNYVKITQKVLEKGKNYPEEQIQRLEDMLENDKGSISDMKKESMSQRVYTLKRFTEPETFADKDVMTFLVKVGMNVLTLLLMLVMIPMMFLTSPDDEEEEGETKKEGEDGAEMEDPDKDDDEGSDPDTPLLTKQEKRALEIQRAKDSWRRTRRMSNVSWKTGSKQQRKKWKVIKSMVSRCIRNLGGCRGNNLKLVNIIYKQT